MNGKTQERKVVGVERCENPQPMGSFGYASETFEIRAGDADLSLVELPLAEDFAARQIDVDSVHPFRWDDEDERWKLVPGGRLTDDRSHIELPITSGRFVLIGRSTNPLVRNVVSLTSTLRWALETPELREQILDPICRLILCPGGVLDTLSGPTGVEHGLDGLYPRFPLDPCERCFGVPAGGFPELQIPPIKIDFKIPPKLVLCPPDPDPMCDLGAWLDRHPAVREAIVWRDADVHPYNSWTAAQKQELAVAFTRAINGQDQGLAAEPPSTAQLNNSGTIFSAHLARADAWSYYIGYLAQTLYLEVCRKVPWSIVTMTADEQSLLLDSETMFHYAAAHGRWLILRHHNILFSHGAAMPGDPGRIYNDFLLGEGLVGGSELETVASVLEWCRDNMHHFYGSYEPANMAAHWNGYSKWPPVETVIAGSTYAPVGHDHFTAGCWGTTGFLRYVLRAVNIPVLLEERCGHALPCFPTIDRYLSHGDDPYNANTWAAGATGEDMMIDGATFAAWFGPGADPCTNVGRVSREFGA